VVLLFLDLGDLAELVHVQLADKGCKVLVAEVVGKHLLLELFGVLYDDLIVPKPC
jgi:hypothetical protein